MSKLGPDIAPARLWSVMSACNSVPIDAMINSAASGLAVALLIGKNKQLGGPCKTYWRSWRGDVEKAQMSNSAGTGERPERQ